ncbi:MAG: Dabb family protein [Vicinamibacterales bacterium]
MIVHVVLFTPKASLTAAERRAFVEQLDMALAAIPDIARARIGQRLALDRAYERLGPIYEYVAILEFETAEALARYLEHPAHAALGAAFHETLERAVASDYRLVDDVDALRV